MPRGFVHHFLCSAAASAICWRSASAAVFSAELDAEIAALHVASEEHWVRLGSLSAHLQKAGAISAGVGGLPGATIPSGGPALGPKLQVNLPDTPQPAAGFGADSAVVAHPTGAGSNRIAPEMVERLRKLQSESALLQQTAFRIGRESSDNAELSQHPEVNQYVSNMRDFNTKLKDAIRDLEDECIRITGSIPEAPKNKKKKRPKQIQGLSEAHIREGVQAKLAKDDRQYRARAMDQISTFRERQLQMQDKQRDLQLTMDGPDWPKEDWPLTTEDAKQVGDAELLITEALAQLNAEIDSMGGLARVHESDSEPALEQLAVLSEMMSAYIELIDKHVATVKRTQNTKKKKKKTKQAAASAESSTTPPVGGSLRDSLLSFGAKPAAEQPFAWLRQGASSQATPFGSMPTPQQQQGSQGFGNFGGFGGLGGAPAPGDVRQSAGFPPTPTAVPVSGMGPGFGSYGAGTAGMMGSGLGGLGMPSASSLGSLGASMPGMPSASSLGSLGASMPGMPSGSGFSTRAAFADHSNPPRASVGSFGGSGASYGGSPVSGTGAGAFGTRQAPPHPGIHGTEL